MKVGGKRENGSRHQYKTEMEILLCSDPIDVNKFRSNSDIMSCLSRVGWTFWFFSSSSRLTQLMYMSLIIAKNALISDQLKQLTFDIVFHCFFCNEDSDMVFVDFPNPVATFVVDTSSP